MAPGLHLKVQTYSEILRMTVAYAAAASLLRALVEWRELHAAGVPLSSATSAVAWTRPRPHVACAQDKTRRQIHCHTLHSV